MSENFSAFSEVPKKSPEYTPPVVPANEIKGTADLGMPHPKRDAGLASDESLDADILARLMDTGPKPGESEEAYQERMRVYRQGLEEDDHLDAKYPPSLVHSSLESLNGK